MSASETDQIGISFKCPDCGPTDLSLPENPTDDSVAKCKLCGQELARFGDIKARSLELARAKKDRIARPFFDEIKRSFKSL